MSPELQTILNDAVIATQKVVAVAQAINGSPLTALAERLIPGLSGIVTEAMTDVALVGALGTALPALAGAYEVYKMLGGKPNQDLDSIGPGRNEPGSGGSSGGT